MFDVSFKVQKTKLIMITGNYKNKIIIKFTEKEDWLLLNDGCYLGTVH